MILAAIYAVALAPFEGFLPQGVDTKADRFYKGVRSYIWGEEHPQSSSSSSQVPKRVVITAI